MNWCCCLPIYEIFFPSELRLSESRSNTTNTSNTYYNSTPFSYENCIKLLNQIDEAGNRADKEEIAREFYDLLVENVEYVVANPGLSECAREKLIDFSKDGFRLDWHYRQLYGTDMPDDDKKSSYDYYSDWGDTTTV